jgi:hypothetical protein
MLTCPPRWPESKRLNILYNASLPFVDVHIFVGTEGSNSEFGGSKRGGGCGIG